MSYPSCWSADRSSTRAEAVAAEEYDDPYAALEELAASGVLV
jgi:hypothetical protein